MEGGEGDFQVIAGGQLRALVRPNTSTDDLLDIVTLILTRNGFVKTATKRDAGVLSFSAEHNDGFPAEVHVTLGWTTVANTTYRTRQLTVDFSTHDSLTSIFTHSAGELLGKLMPGRRRHRPEASADAVTPEAHLATATDDEDSYYKFKARLPSDPVLARAELYRRLRLCFKADFTTHKLTLSFLLHDKSCQTPVALDRTFMRDVADAIAGNYRDELGGAIEANVDGRICAAENATRALVSFVGPATTLVRWYPPPPEPHERNVPAIEVDVSGFDAYLASLGHTIGSIHELSPTFQTWIEDQCDEQLSAALDAIDVETSRVEQKHEEYQDLLVRYLTFSPVLADSSWVADFRERFRFRSEVCIGDAECTLLSGKFPIGGRVAFSPRYFCFGGSLVGNTVTERIDLAEIEDISPVSGAFGIDHALAIRTAEETFTFGFVPAARRDRVHRAIEIFIRRRRSEMHEAMKKVENDKGPAYLIEDVYENERLFPFVDWSHTNLLPGDRKRWSDVDGREVHRPMEDETALPPGNYTWADDWRVDVDGNVDDIGWEYATNFGNATWVAKPEWNHVVRRRRWWRSCRAGPGGSPMPSSPKTELPTADSKADGETAAGDVSTESGFHNLSIDDSPVVASSPAPVPRGTVLNGDIDDGETITLDHLEDEQ